MRLQKVDRSYLGLIEELHKMVFPVDDWEDHPNHQYWVLFDGKMPVGFCTCYPLTYEKDTVFMSRAGILSEYRGLGLHLKMIKARIKWAKSNGYVRVITYTAKENASSYSNLQKLGFLLYEPACAYVGREFLYWMKTFKR